MVNGETYHIFTRSIADYVIFNDARDFERMIEMIAYYQIADPPTSFSAFSRLEYVKRMGFDNAFQSITIDQEEIVQIIAYCFMPTHIHLILKQLKNDGISVFMGNILNSYSRYFNTRHQRKGPLWESRFHNVLIKTDEQLLHLTRYLHLNPVSASLCDDPKDWPYSSYHEYLGLKREFPICQFNELLDIQPQKYQQFVLERARYQRELSKIKKLLLE